MARCSICGTEQKEIGTLKWRITNKDGESEKDYNVSPCYNINLMTGLKGKEICDNCMDIYRKIYALEHNIDFSCGSNMYYADGRNLD